MPFDGAGTYSPPAADFPVVTLTTVSSTHFNNTVNDMSTGISLCVTRSGQSPWTGNLPAGGFKVTGMAAGTLRGDSVRAAEAQDSTYLYGGTAGGTADALTFTLAPAITAYVTGQMYTFKSGTSPNTTAATLAINGIASPKAIQRDGLALVAGDIEASKFYSVLYDGTAFQLIRLSERILLTTGDVKITIKTTADTGWVLMDDTTIGNAASGATGRANADTVALYTLLYNNTTNANCAVSGGRGANAAADYAANKTIALPKALGRALATSGSGSGLTARALAVIAGTETQVISTAHLPASGLSIPALGVTVNSTVGDIMRTAGGVQVSSGSGDPPFAATGITSTGSTATGTTGNMGTAATALPLLQPSIFLTVMIKL